MERMTLNSCVFYNVAKHFSLIFQERPIVLLSDIEFQVSSLCEETFNPHCP